LRPVFPRSSVRDRDNPAPPILAADKKMNRRLRRSAGPALSRERT
jgi:hypothetical protein